MVKEQLYTIGEVSKLCNVSAKALRFYDKIGMIAPDKISESGYRYYSLDTILSIPIVKYYKQMGFRPMSSIHYEPNAYYIFDRAYDSFKELYRIHLTDSFFVVDVYKRQQSYRRLRPERGPVQVQTG